MRYKAGARFLGVLSLLLVCSLGCTTSEKGPVRAEDFDHAIRVACIGDSITYGSGIRDRDVNSYPAQLGAMLGDKWDVRNFGVSGATMLKKSDKPYWDEKAFAHALAFDPDVVIIKLGTNDSKSHWDAAGFEADYGEMLDAFAGLESGPRIWVCLPVPAYEERWQIRDSIISSEVIPIIRRVAAEKNVEVIDLYTALSGVEELFPDKIHPNEEGAGVMAGEIYMVLTGKAGPVR